MRKIIWVLLLVCVCMAGSVFGQERVVEALKVENEGVIIDGNLDDEVWQKGEWATGFTIIGKTHREARAQTSFKVAYDENQLYFAVKMQEPYVSKFNLETIEFKRDSNFREDDAIKIMISPYGDQNDYYVLATNIMGVQFDEKWSLHGLLHEVQWDAEWKVATKIGGREWTVEMAIPFVELGLDERSLKDWKFNIIRNRYVGEESSSYSPMADNSNGLNYFTFLKFGPHNFKKYLWNIKGPYEYFVGSDVRWDWFLKGSVEVENKGSGNSNFKLIFKQLNQTSLPIIGIINGALGDKEHATGEFRMPIKKKTPLKLKLELVNLDNPQDVWRVERWTLPINYDPMQLSFVEPSYRDMVYSTENLSEIKLDIDFILSPQRLKNSKLRLQVLAPNEERDKDNNIVYGTLRKELVVEEVLVNGTYTLPIEDLGFGTYLVKTELLSRRGEVIYSREKEIKKLRPVPYEWRVDPDGNLRKNGKVVMPTGFFKMTVEELEKRKGEYSAIFQSRGNILNTTDAKEHLDKLEKLGAYAVLYPYPDASFIASRVEGLGQSLLEKEKEVIQAHVKSLRKHPALMAWVIAFLPDNETISPQRLKLIYDVVSTEDPFHPCVIVISSNRSILEYSQIADILMPFTKIPFLKDEGPSRPLSLVFKQFDLIDRLKKPGSMFWTCLQAYDQTTPMGLATRMPNVDECRSMLYQSIIKGAKGFFWYHFNQFKNYPEMELITQFLAQELKLLQNAIIAPSIPVEIEGENEGAPSSETILTMLKKVGDDYYLFAVNLSGEKKEAELTIPEAKNKKVLNIMSEGREVKLTDKGTFNDTFKAFEAHIYSTKSLSGSTIQELKQRLKVERENKKKAGNLAFMDSGVAISVSSSAIKKPNLNVLVDGTFAGMAWESDHRLGLPQWVELKWPNPIKANHVIIYTNTVEEAELQIKENNNWVSIGAFKKMSAGHLESQFERKQFSEMRVWITSKAPEVKDVSLSEIEVYNRTLADSEK